MSESNDARSNRGGQQLRLRSSDPEIDSYHYDCPDCGHWVAEWMDCPSCGWYDGDVWRAAVKRRKNGTAIEAANPVDLEGMR